MELNLDETTLVAHKDNDLNDKNTYLILSKNDGVTKDEIEDVIHIIDETGIEVSCTYNKFVEIFDQEGLAGFIM